MARTQAERSEAMREALLGSARERFGRSGYTATSIDDIARPLGVTRGAFYHHFRSKQEIFRAVFEAEERAITSALASLDPATDDPAMALRIGCRAFLDQCMEPLRQRIYLVDGEAVLGWECVREIEAGSSLALLERSVGEAVKAGRLHSANAQALSRLLYGTLCEAAMAIAKAPSPAAAHPAIATEIDLMLERLAK